MEVGTLVAKRSSLHDCRTGKLVRELAYLPLALDIPIQKSACRKGPREMEWRDDKPSTLYWIEAQVQHHFVYT